MHQPTPEPAPWIDERLPLLFYCHDSLRFGHSARSALVASLASHFQLAVVGDDAAMLACDFPPQAEVVRLPAAAAARGARHDRLMDTYRRLDPAVVIIEQYPFGCAVLSEDVESVLDAAAANPRTRLVACSVWETLVDLPLEPSRRDDPVQRLANRCFDVVFVHADARLGRLEHAFDANVLRVPVLYTGFVASRPEGEVGAPATRRPMVLVTCDGARPDAALFRAALSACDHWLPGERLPMRIVAGPALPDRDLAALQAEAALRDEVIVERAMDDLRVTSKSVAVSISDGACDTVFEMLRAGVPALVVPGGWGDDERGEWSHRLAALGVVSLLDRDRLTGPALAAELAATILRPPPFMDVNRAGADETLRLVARLAEPAAIDARSIAAC